MKKYLLYIVIFLIGVLAGMWAHRQYHFRDITEMSQNDTIVVFDTVKYSRLDLATNSYRLDVPNIGIPEVVYIPYDSTTIIYRDSIRYVTMPRQYFFTETEDAQIWHSGIDSTIDSLNVVRKTQEITKTTQTVTKRNALSIGVEAKYATTLNAPAYLQYESRIKSWMSFYARLEYDIVMRQWGAGTGVKMMIQW